MPNGNPAPGPKLDYKLAWFKRFQKYGKRVLKSGVPFVMAGDFNVMPTELDVYAPERWVDDAFWDYFRNAFARDAGLRIDHLLLSPALKGRLVSGGVDSHVRGWEKTSDHAPVWVELET